MCDIILKKMLQHCKNIKNCKCDQFVHDCGLINVKVQITHLIAKTFNALKGIAYRDTLLSGQLTLTQNIWWHSCYRRAI